jgi:hypothetical protein
VNKERENEDCYLSVGPVMYAQTLTRTSVRQAPASPESMYLALKNAGRIATNAGIMYSEVKSAMTPAMNPNIATNPKTLNLSFILFTFCFRIKSSLFLV